MYITFNNKFILMMNKLNFPQFPEKDQGWLWLPEVFSSVSTLLQLTEKENIWEDERKNILMVQNELKNFQQEAEVIYFKYFNKLKENQVEMDNSGACCTIADIEVENAFKKFVENSVILKEYTVIWEETGITEWTNEGNDKYIFIDPIDCTHWFKKWKFWSGSIIGIYHWWKNVAWMTLDISNELSYHHSWNEYEILHKGKVIKSKKRYWFEYIEYEYSENEWIQKGHNSKDLYVYSSCKWQNWEKWDSNKFSSLFENSYTEYNIKVWTHRSITALNSALWLNKGFVHYWTSAHDFSHMVWFTQAAGGILMDHNGNVITEIDIKQVEENYKKWMKLKKGAKKLKNQAEEYKKKWDMKSSTILLEQSRQKELEYRNYIYTFPIIVAKDYNTAKRYAKLLRNNFWKELNNMQTEALPKERREAFKINRLLRSIREWIKDTKTFT